MANSLKNHFGDSLVALSFPGVASILTFRKSCHFRLQNSNDVSDKDVKEFAERLKTETERTYRTLYKIQFDSNTICEGCSDTLMNLLSGLKVPQLQSIMIGLYNFLNTVQRLIQKPLKLLRWSVFA